MVIVPKDEGEVASIEAKLATASSLLKFFEQQLEWWS